MNAIKDSGGLSSTNKIYELLLGVDIQLSINRLDMRLNSPDRHAHKLSNLLLAVALSQKTRDLGLALSESKALKRSRHRVSFSRIEATARSRVACQSPKSWIHSASKEHDRNNHKGKGHRSRKQSGRLQLRKTDCAQHARDHHIAEQRGNCVREQKRHGKRGKDIVRIMGFIGKHEPK